jgi:hypothetical protein
MKDITSKVRSVVWGYCTTQGGLWHIKDNSKMIFLMERAVLIFRKKEKSKQNGFMALILFYYEALLHHT